MERRALPIIMLVMLVVVIVVTTIFAFSIGPGLLNALGLGPTPTPIPLPTPTPTPTPSPTPTPDPDKPPLVNAKAVFLIDMDSQRVLDSVHSTSRLGNASTTKIMTALVAMRLGNLNQVMIIPQEAVDRVNVDGASSAGLVAVTVTPGRTAPLSKISSTVCWYHRAQMQRSLSLMASVAPSPPSSTR